MNATEIYKNTRNDMKIFGLKSGESTAKQRSSKIIPDALADVPVVINSSNVTTQ
jgi:hypothetical protein